MTKLSAAYLTCTLAFLPTAVAAQGGSPIMDFPLPEFNVLQLNPRPVIVAANFALPDQTNLRPKVYAEYPRLDPQHPQHGNLSDWDVVCMLREFSYRHTSYSNNVNSHAYRAGAATVDELLNNRRTLAATYDFFDNDGGGVLCGHTAHLLQRLYTEFGYQAWYTGHGFSPPTPRGSRFTHAETLVRINLTRTGKPRQILTLHDPSTNLSYVDAHSNKPLDYFDMLNRLVDRRAETIGIRGTIDDGIDRRHPSTIFFSDETNGRRPEFFQASWNVGRDFELIKLGNETWKLVGPRRVEAFERLGDSWWKNELVTEGMPPETIYLHCFPFHVSGSPQAEEILKQAQAIVRLGRPANEKITRHSSPQPTSR